jgi:DNA polymerase III alpha subunit
MPSVEQKITPIFVSNYSIGKSLLTLSEPKKSLYPDGPESIFKILEENGMKSLTLVDTTPFGFFEAYSYCHENKIKFVYGLYFEISQANSKKTHRVILFMKGPNSYAPLMALYSLSSKSNGVLSEEQLRQGFDKNHFAMAIPFYDSFLFKNALNAQKFTFDPSHFEPIFFLENNSLPFDEVMAEIVTKFCADKYESLQTKTILYKNRDDVKNLIVYRILTSRDFGKAKTFSRPNLDWFGSDDFSFQSYLEARNKPSVSQNE